MLSSDLLALRFYHAALTLTLANRIRKRSGGWRAAFRRRPPIRPLPLRLGVLAIMKNESHLIEEWIEHYLAFGADRIFLIDNGSTDDTLAKVQPWVNDGRVEVVVLTGQAMQQQHYWSAFRHFRLDERCDWLAIADIDEFWFCKSGESLADYLDRQTGRDAVYANWTVFGSDGHVAQPPSVRRALTKCSPKLDRFTKCIFRTSIPQQVDDIEVHFIRNVPLRRAKIANRDIQLNHYVTQSREFWFTVKMRRGDVFFPGQSMERLAARFDEVNAAATRTCTRLQDLLAR